MSAPSTIERGLPPGVAAMLVRLDAVDVARDVRRLSADERERAGRYRFARDRDRYVARRGAARVLLGQLLGRPPEAVRIAADANGKPYCADDPALCFNLSHSQGLALCVVAGGRAVGCDIECRNPKLACPAVARRLFAPAECDALFALPEDDWAAGFFNCWTRKEAYVKALGLGLSYPLDAFSVSVAPGLPARFTSDEPGWTLIAFEPAPGFQAAVAIGDGTVLSGR